MPMWPKSTWGRPRGKYRAVEQRIQRSFNAPSAPRRRTPSGGDDFACAQTPSGADEDACAHFELTERHSGRSAVAGPRLRDRAGRRRRKPNRVAAPSEAAAQLILDPTKLAEQELSEQAVVAVPLPPPVEGDQEQTRRLEIAQPFLSALALRPRRRTAEHTVGRAPPCVARTAGHRRAVASATRE